MNTIPPEVLPCLMVLAGVFHVISPALSYATAAVGALYAIAMVVEYVRIGRSMRRPRFPR